MLFDYIIKIEDNGIFNSANMQPLQFIRFPNPRCLKKYENVTKNSLTHIKQTGCEGHGTPRSLDLAFSSGESTQQHCPCRRGDSKLISFCNCTVNEQLWLHWTFHSLQNCTHVRKFILNSVGRFYESNKFKSCFTNNAHTMYCQTHIFALISRRCFTA